MPKSKEQTVIGKVHISFPSNPRRWAQDDGISALLIPSSMLRVIWKSNNENVIPKCIWEKHMSHCGFAKSPLRQVGSVPMTVTEFVNALGAVPQDL